MTIKEIENLLEIPRATVRFYEKEGLLTPAREGNGYRDYSEDDVEKLRKIIILRKIGVSVEEINDIFDGAKSLQEVLDININNLNKQMKELKGAISLSQKMKEDTVEITSMDTDLYWNEINEEEKKGNLFIDIAKDIVEMEKGIVISHFINTDENGKMYDSIPKLIFNVILATVITGCMACLFKGTWTISVFMEGITVIASFILIEAVLSIPLYFLGKKYSWIKNNRKKAYLITCIVLLVLLLFIAILL